VITRKNVEKLAEQLIDTSEVAEILGLTDPRGVYVYQDRYSDMPRPIVDRGKNKVKLWYKPEIVEWHQSRKSN
jgi:glutathione-regulated potassium-efflux system ancillary protein KefG